MLSRLLHTLVLDVQFGRIRLLPLAILIGYLLISVSFETGKDGPRMLMLVAAILLVGGGAWPLPVVLVETALYLVGSPSGTAPAAVAFMTALPLLELAVRRPLRQAGAVAIGLTAAHVTVALVVGGIGVGRVVAGLVVMPMLLGVLLRLVLRGQKERHLGNLRRARQAERVEIARELHDLVAHHVASMALRTGVARAVLPDLDPRVRAVLDDVHDSATTALADLRRLVGVLRDQSAGAGGSRLVHVDPADLPAAVAEVVERGARAGLTVTGHVDPAIATLDSVRGLAVLRVVQEGLTNVTKHAADAHATVRVELHDHDVCVEVVDDGGAADRPPPLPAAESGYGLVGLRERIELIGGILTAGRRTDGRRGGWRLHAVLPPLTEHTVEATEHPAEHR